MGVSNILRSSARALPVAVSLLTAAAWAQPGGMSTGGNTQRPLNVSGKVAMEDGMTPGEKVAIEVLCPPNSQIQGRTDLKGAFNVELGFGRYQGNGDASMSSSASRAGFGGQLSVGRTVNQVDGMSIIALMGCFLRAALPGYTSDQSVLGQPRRFRRPTQRREDRKPSGRHEHHCLDGLFLAGGAARLHLGSVRPRPHARGGCQHQRRYSLLASTGERLDNGGERHKPGRSKRRSEIRG